MSAGEDLRRKVEELKHRLESLEQLVRSLLSRIPEVRVEVQVPKVILERRMELVKISENELYGRIIRLAVDGFFDQWRSVSEVTKELIRKGWAPKDLKHVRPAIEHLVTLELLEKRSVQGRKARWLYRKAENFGDRVVITEGATG